MPIDTVPAVRATAAAQGEGLTEADLRWSNMVSKTVPTTNQPDVMKIVDVLGIQPIADRIRFLGPLAKPVAWVTFPVAVLVGMIFFPNK